MNRSEFRKRIAESILILDGATGTELAKKGLPAGCCPEAWILDHPQAMLDLQKSYIQAGSTIIYTPTFGGNRHKLANFGLQDQADDMNRRLAALSREAAGSRAAVFGDLAPTGLMVEPMDGGAPFDDIMDIYRQQARSLLDAGVEGFVIETMLDIQEARAALLAVRELAPDMPVLCSMTYEQDGRTLTGTDPATAVVILQSLGADAVGCNCSAGPAEMARLIAAMRPYARVPLIAKPNAGLPKLVNGKTQFEMDAAAFAATIPALVEAGAGLIGGCCGTTPEHIRMAAETARTLPVPTPAEHIPVCLASSRKIVSVSPDRPFAIIGERINPTGKKALQAELRQNDFSLVRSFAREQELNGAAVLDVNMGLPGGDEKALMTQAIRYLTQDSALPLCIDTTKPDVAEAALKLYPGRAIFNSISAETDRLEKVLPVVAKYGAMLILLPLDDNGIPATAQERITIIQNLFEKARQYGYTKEEVAVDGLVMTVSANPQAANATLELIDWAARTWKTNTVCGLSNISFGLPRRDLINRAFLGMAIGRGLNMAIANPMLQDIRETALASDVLALRDENAQSFVRTFAAAPASASAASVAPAPAAAESLLDQISACVLNGDDSSIVKVVHAALDQNHAADAIVNTALIPAITAVGDKYERKEYYLPQLLSAAKAMRTAMDILLPRLAASPSAKEPQGRIILATVKGDIHDIGKNIVAMMLRNYGFQVLDLGKDVDAETIIDTAVKENISLIGLSALMTTTMTRMKEVIDLAREKGLAHLRFIVGGAVLDQAYADSIGAHYAADAMATVRIAQSLR